MAEQSESAVSDARTAAGRLAEYACRELDAQAAWLFAWDQPRGLLRLLAHRGVAADRLDELRAIGVGAPFVEARAARDRSAQVCRGDVAAAGLAGSDSVLSRLGAAGLLALPVASGARLVGVLTIAVRSVDRLAPPAIREAQAFAELLAVGLSAILGLEVERRLRAQLDAVRQAALALAEAEDLAAALQIIVEQAKRLVGARYAALGIVREDAPEAPFFPWVQSGVSPEQTAAIGRGPRPVGLLGAVPREGRPIRLQTLTLDPRFRGYPPNHPHVRNFLGVPIRSRGRPVGNLYLGDKEGAEEFDEEDERATTLLAEHAGAAVERFRDLAKLKLEHAAGDRARRALAVHSSTARVLAEAPPVKVAAGRILRALGEALGWEWGCLWLIDRSANALRFTEAWRAQGLEVPRFEEMTRQLSFPPGVGLPGRVWEQGRPLWAADVIDDPRFLRLGVAAREGLHAALFVPVTADGRTLGVLELMSRTVRQPDEELLLMLTAFGTEIGQLIERRRVEDDRERLLSELAAERSWLHAVVERSPVGMVLAFAPGGERVLVNHRAEELLGQSIEAEGGIGQLGEKLCRADGSALDAGELPATLALERGEIVSGVELVCRRPDGDRAILVNAAPIEDGTGARIGAAMVLEDISSLRELQRLREEWTSMVAHDLRQPVSTIATAAAVLARGGAQPSVKSLAEGILSGSRRLDRMIADLLDASRIDARRLRLSLEEVDPAALIRGAVERFDAGGREIRVAAAAVLPGVRVDPGRIEQVLGNLLANALKYGVPGAAVEVTAEAAGDEVRISVVNAAPEIAAQDLEGLFARFQRGAPTAGRRVAGTGLGLYIARSLVEAHGGRIWAERVPPGRIAFRFTLPAERSVSAPAER